jgi:hypothetical protein
MQIKRERSATAWESEVFMLGGFGDDDKLANYSTGFPDDWKSVFFWIGGSRRRMFSGRSSCLCVLLRSLLSIIVELLLLTF